MKEGPNPLLNELLLCPQCGYKVQQTDSFCENCGVELSKARIKQAHTPVQKSSVDLSEDRSTSSVTSLSLADKIAPHSVKKNLRAAYFDVGALLSKQGNHKQAAEMLQKALEAGGKSPSQGMVKLYLAEVQERAGENKESLRSYLEAALAMPQHLDLLLPHAQTLLTPITALANAQWIRDVWLPGIQSHKEAPTIGVQLMLFQGQLQTCLAEYQPAMETFKKAIELNSAESMNSLTSLLERHLTPLLAERRDSREAVLFEAKLHQLLERFTESLQVLNRALEAGVPGDEQYPETPLLQLKADLLEALGRKEEAVNLYFEAGQRYYWRNEHVLARPLLKKAKDEQHILAHWYLADTLRVLSYQDSTEEEKAALMEGSRRVWEEGAAIRLPGVDDSWSYIVRGLINEQLVMLPGADRHELFWEATVYFERAILLYDADAFRWAYLARYHRSIENEATALHAAAHAMQIDKDHLAALDEWAAALADVGRFAEAEVAIDRRRELEPSLWADTVKALLLFQRNLYQEALDLIEKVIASDETQAETVWNIGFRAYCKRALGKREDAWGDYLWIFQKKNSNDQENLSSYAAAAFELTEYDEALALYQKIMELPGGYKDNVQRDLGWYYLTRNDKEQGLNFLLEGVKNARHAYQLEDLLRLEIMEVEQGLVPWPYSDTERAEILGLIKNAIRERIDREKQSATPEEEHRKAVTELEFLSAKLEEGGKKDSWAWVGAQAGLARLLAEASWYAAGELYQSLQEYASKFPEGRIGIEKTVDGLETESGQLVAKGLADRARRALESAIRFENVLNRPNRQLKLHQLLGDVKLKADQFDLAAVTFEQALHLPAALENWQEQGNLYVRLGYSRFWQAGAAAALEPFRKAIDVYARSGVTAPGLALGQACRGLIPDEIRFWMLYSAFQRYAATETDLRGHFEVAQADLLTFLDGQFLMGASKGDTADQPVMISPIVLEMDEALVPPEVLANNSAPWDLIQSWIPDMRARTLENTGVRIPPVHVRSNVTDLKPGGYLVKIQEVPVVIGKVYKDRVYCFASVDRLREIQVPSNAVLPDSAPAGAWVDRAYAPMLKEKGLETWEDPRRFMIYHLERVLLDHLSDLLGIQEIINLLQERAEPELVKQALPNDLATLRFVRLLRALLSENVPIRDLSAILEMVREIGLPNDDIYTALRAVRLRLQKDLPGNQEGDKLVDASAQFEAKISRWLVTQDGKRFLAIPPEDVQDLFDELSRLMGRHPERFVLLVNDPELRAYVRRLIKSEYPQVYALARNESMLQEEPNKSDSEGNIHAIP